MTPPHHCTTTPPHHRTTAPWHHSTTAPPHHRTIKSVLPLLLLVALLLVNSACNRNNNNRIIVIGEVEGLTGMVYLQEQTTFELLKIDSMLSDANGSFLCNINTDQISIYSVRVTPDDQVVFIAGPGDTIHIKGALTLFPASLSASGNEESELLQSFYDYSDSNLKEVDSLQLLIDNHQGDDDFFELTLSVDSLFNLIWVRQRNYEKEFIREHAGAFATLLVVNYHFGVRPVLSPKTDRDDYHKVDSGLIANYPENRHALFFHQWVKEIK